MARPGSPFRRVEWERQTRRLMRRANVPGLSVGLVRRGSILAATGYGYRDRAARSPATARTVYGLGSITKTFTALALLRLQEHGLLNVDDPVVRHLPEFRTPGPRPARPITLHHLLTHTSGLPPLAGIFYAWARNEPLRATYGARALRRVGIDPDHPPIDSFEQLLDYLAREPFRWLGAPGQQFSYSNEGFAVLGAVIERAGGRSYESCVEEEILHPAGMRTTSFDPGVLRRSREDTKLYLTEPRHADGRLLASEAWYEDGGIRPSGGLRTNVEDMLRLLELFLRGGRVGAERIVSPASLREMLRPHVEVFAGRCYGYGIVVRPDYHGRLLALHSGGKPGVSANFAVVPSAGVGGVVLANCATAPSDRVLEAGLNPLLGIDPSSRFLGPPELQPTSASLAEYAGWYGSGESNWYEMRPHRGYLRVDDRGLPPRFSGYALRPCGGDDFVLQPGGRNEWVRFVRDRRRRIQGVMMGWRFVRRRDPTRPGRLRGWLP